MVLSYTFSGGAEEGSHQGATYIYIPEEIIEDLANKGFIAKYVRPIQPRTGRRGRIFFAIMENTENLLPGIYNVREMLHMPGIQIEAWKKKKGVAQCHRCQAFRHSSLGCHRKMACVRCGEAHAARDCPRPLDVAATCANCGGAHPANFAACPQFRREIKNKRAGIAPLSRTRAATRFPNLPARPVSDTIHTDPRAPNLMAAANPPTERGIRRRKRGKRKRRIREDATPPRPQLAPTEYVQLRPSAEAPDAHAPTATTRPASMAIHRVIDIVREVLIALKDGADPVAVVMDALCSILNNAQLEQIEATDNTVGSSVPPPPTITKSSKEQQPRSQVA